MNDIRIGWIGTGVMGRSMCGHLLKAGYPARVYNRSRAKAEPLAAQGAVLCSSPAEVARESDVIFSIVGFPRDVEEVLLGQDGVVQAAAPGSVVVDMTTSEPSLAIRIHAEAGKRGLAALDAPVSGGDLGAREATLAIMVGGEPEVFDRVRPLFECMGKNVRLMGGPGAGQHTKMSNQILIAGTMIGVVESLLYARKAGLPLDPVIDVIGSGAAGSWSINNLGRRIAKGDFDPGFFIKHFVKDMGIALAEARAMNLSLPGLALAQQFYVSAQALGLENLGTQGLYKVLERINGF
ncbi:NAD(P)-binding domain-containing protein [Desulfovibrio aminophilus]|uniref:NAD(P)-dependent oxidoreductase n=1 Tax=Desulfovibrio aminophilus TaxID=81425 RepID=UPI00339B5A27